MTIEEALYYLDTIPTIGEQVDALEMAIKSLEAWKKIKEEIKEKADFIRHSSGHLKDYDAGQWKALLDALEIINWHFTEVENADSN